MPTGIRSKYLSQFLDSEISIYPLALFRVLFGLLLLWGMLRFWYYGWIDSLYIEPDFHFSYWGFEWVKPFGEGTSILFLICGISALCLALGLRYRLSVSITFLSFTYIELMDKTTYLNHYYFVAIILFCLLFLPAGRALSLDVWLAPNKGLSKIRRWHYAPLWALLCLVYFYAGLAKLNSDWLIEAQPLRLWLPGRASLPLIGSWLKEASAAFVFSWAGALYDLSIPFLLWNRRSRGLAFFLILVFHVLTRILFPIGIFPYVMIIGAILFFDGKYVERLLKPFSNFSITSRGPAPAVSNSYKLLLALVISWQLLWPWRYLAYPGELFWHEQGFRFSWRVMLMEKAAYTQFKIVIPEKGRSFWVQNENFLTPFQEKQMSFQPDFILEFAHHLGAYYREAFQTETVEVYAESQVALNGRPSQAFVDPNQNLLNYQWDIKPYSWLMPFNDTIYGL